MEITHGNAPPGENINRIYLMAKVRKRLLPSGKVTWLADYRDGAGERRSRQFATKKAADAFLVKAQHEVGHGTHVADSASVTVNEACRLWIDRAANDGLERSTVDQYRQHADIHIKPALGGRKLSKLTTPAIQKFADDLGKSVSRVMVRKVLGSLSGVFDEARRQGFIANNPVTAVKVGRQSSREVKELEMPSKTELAAILNSTPDRHKAFIWTAVFTGMRASELRGLMWQDVDLDAGVVHVRRRADRYNNIGFPKSRAGTRKIPVPPSVVALLKGWREECPAGELNLVFPNGAGNVENHGNLLARIFWPIQIAAGVSVETGETDDEGSPVMDAKYSMHALRHAAASMFIEQRMTPKRIQVLMGHSSIQMTFDVYGKLFPQDEDDAAAIKAIEDRLLAAR
ncbi:site-specific recombinase XerD [Camelimonas lactis]|uniref:Site-specific recombinase XerD n=2 Tax=Camelimonas lactis TaxID=659006 RepID=A0A4R2GIN1_9HYPH|nr:site-specific recombinase XerD [Camelimonas lactis]